MQPSRFVSAGRLHPRLPLALAEAHERLAADHPGSLSTGYAVLAAADPDLLGLSVVSVTGKGALGTLSPLMDPEGNSVRGGLAARDLTRRLGLDVLASRALDGGFPHPQG